jgi:NADPH-dependent curcumin reductase CurA
MKVIGSTSSKEKAEYLRVKYILYIIFSIYIIYLYYSYFIIFSFHLFYLFQELGFDHVINYKTENIDLKLKEYAPEGLDVYFDKYFHNSFLFL